MARRRKHTPRALRPGQSRARRCGGLHVTGTNRIQAVLLGMQNRTFCSFWQARNHRTLAPAGQCAVAPFPRATLLSMSSGPRSCAPFVRRRAKADRRRRVLGLSRAGRQSPGAVVRRATHGSVHPCAAWHQDKAALEEKLASRLDDVEAASSRAAQLAEALQASEARARELYEANQILENHVQVRGTPGRANADAWGIWLSHSLHC
jgi:hypothetical protein